MNYGLNKGENEKKKEINQNSLFVFVVIGENDNYIILFQFS